jgi:ABC-type Mn2+/Zn2+ transport system ATPase subunit
MIPAISGSSLLLAYGRGPVILELEKFVVEQGTCVALTGPNGGGKSTLLKALSGRLMIRTGVLEVFDAPAATRSSRVAYIGQSHDFDQEFPLTVSDLVGQGCLALCSWPRWRTAEDTRRVKKALEQLDLTALGEQPVGTLSGGQWQRALLARAIVREAKLFLLDEPFSAVDSQSRIVAWRVLKQAQRQGATILLATHDTEDLEYCDRVIGLKRVLTSDVGRVLSSPAPAFALPG